MGIGSRVEIKEDQSKKSDNVSLVVPKYGLSDLIIPSTTDGLCCTKI